MLVLLHQAKTTNMKLLSFTKRFSDEETCREYLRQKREEQGITCKRCKCQKHYWISTMELWKCAKCKSRTNLRAGTIMEKSHIPVLTWFTCMHLMTSTKKSISALEMQNQLSMKRYEPVWYMMQKIRQSMGKRDKNYKLKGHIEVDDAFFHIVDANVDEQRKNSHLNHSRGSVKQGKVLVMVESTPNPKQQNPHKKKRIMGFVKMITMDDLSIIGVNYELKKAVDSQSHIYTDAYPSYKNSTDVVATHTKQVTPKNEAHEKLPWVHTMISNAKRQLLGVHHSIGKPYLQNYLNEFCYKLNRRTFETDLFDRMITAGASDTWF